MTQPMVEAVNLSKIHRWHGQQIRALDRVSLTAEAEEFLVVVGASGSGKSTLLRCLAGLEIPDEGEIRLNDRTVFAHDPKVWIRPQDRRVGMVFQSYAIWPHLSVLENVTLPLIRGTLRIPKARAAEAAMEILERLGLAEFAPRSATALSGGQQQRVALARALAVGGHVILMDEPLSNLDAALRESLRQYLKTVLAEFHTTVVYVTHDRTEALTLGDRVVVMKGGRVIQIGTPNALYLHPQSRYVAETLGEVNWVPAEAGRNGVATTAIGPVALPAGAGNERLILGIRPEGISAEALDGRGPLLGSETLGTVQRVQFSGFFQWVTFSVGATELQARLDPTRTYGQGKKYALRFNPEAMFWIEEASGIASEASPSEDSEVPPVSREANGRG